MNDNNNLGPLFALWIVTILSALISFIDLVFLGGSIKLVFFLFLLCLVESICLASNK